MKISTLNLIAVILKKWLICFVLFALCGLCILLQPLGVLSILYRLPLPVADLREILTVICNILLMLNKLVAHELCKI